MDLSAWDINERDWPGDGTIEVKLKFLIRYAILAPSGHNTQPWLFRLSQNVIQVYADRTRCLPVVDSEDRELVISCGCAIYFLKIAARKFGYQTQVSELPDPSSQDLLATINIVPGETASRAESDLFAAILKRHTNRHKFEQREISTDNLSKLIAAAKEGNSSLDIVTADSARQALAELVAQGDKAQAANKHFRRELSSWVHPNRSRYADGMPGYAFGVSDFASTLGPLVLRTFDWGDGQAAKDQQLALGSPVLAVLSSQSENPLAWLNTGYALASVLLNAASEGISASFLNQPIEETNLRSELKALLNIEGNPQILLRMGYGPEVKPTPRRSVDEVLV